MRTDHCPDCGAAVAGGRDGCQALFDELTARAYSDLSYASVRELALDAYCMQHLDRYSRSAKSYAAHLARLCCGLEHEGNPLVYAAIQKWLNGAVPLEKPPRLPELGQITIVEVNTASGGAEYVKLVRAWAENVWRAYASQQALARAWIQEALEARET